MSWGSFALGAAALGAVIVVVGAVFVVIYFDDIAGMLG